MILFKSYALKKARVEPLRAADGLALSLLHERTFPKPWSRLEFENLLAEASVYAFGIKIKAQLICFALIRIAADEVEILTVATHPSWRGRRCAEQVLLQALGVARTKGVKRCFLEVEEQNRGAITLYKRLGFSENARRKAYYAQSGGGDALLMSRPL